MKNIPQNIRAIRELQGLKQDYIAASIGVCSKTYRLLEAGKSVLTYDRLHRIAEVLGVGVPYIESFDPKRDSPAAVLKRQSEMLLRLQAELSALKQDKELRV